VTLAVSLVTSDAMLFAKSKYASILAAEMPVDRVFVTLSNKSAGSADSGSWMASRILGPNRSAMTLRY
jgi:hypothetical protein